MEGADENLTSSAQSRTRRGEQRWEEGGRTMVVPSEELDDGRLKSSRFDLDGSVGELKLDVNRPELREPSKALVWLEAVVVFGVASLCAERS
jgi:hypothetical protein